MAVEVVEEVVVVASYGSSRIVLCYTKEDDKLWLISTYHFKEDASHELIYIQLYQ